MIFETHAHYDDGRFDEDREQLLNSLKEAGVGPVINIGASLESTKQTMELAEAYDFVYAAVVVHPSEIHELNEESFQWITSLANHPKTVAIVEIGLDYYWDKEEEVQDNQR
ncbi:MAG: TatD family hydrolase, partial [Agathobacter sp.]|nr:TatD family hydrolase [Agathobacter sp.]